MRGRNLRIFAMGLANILHIFTSMTMTGAIDASCDYRQSMILGQPYYVYNTEYPNNYRQGASCRWIGISPSNTKIVLSCEDINLPATTNCASDRVAVSLSGDSNFQDARNYCGKGTLSLVSNANQIVVGLFTAWNSPGGRFLCTITAVQTSTTTTTTTPPPNSCDCGMKQQRRIVGGIEVGVNEYPSMAALINVQLRDLYCGASIISARYALTAAHCTTNRNPYEIGLLVGDHDIDTGADTNAAALYILDKFIVHPNYNSVSQENDVAIVHTQSVIQFNLNVGPVCLPFRYTAVEFIGVSVTVLGWGTLEFSGPKSNTLQGVNLTIVSNADCKNRVTSNTIYSSQICTYATGKDACQSDSGGPAIWIDPTTKRLQLIGVVSYGLGCATSKPGVNSRVTSFLTWIVQETSDAQYCIK